MTKGILKYENVNIIIDNLDEFNFLTNLLNKLGSEYFYYSIDMYNDTNRSDAFLNKNHSIKDRLRIGRPVVLYCNSNGTYSWDEVKNNYRLRTVNNDFTTLYNNLKDMNKKEFEVWRRLQ